MLEVIPDNDDLVIGERLFTDGFVRQVLRDRCGAQYVVDDGERVDGVWIHPDEYSEPIVVELSPQRGAYSLSRLARCTKDAIDLAERLNAAGADLAVIQENVNTRSPMGRFIFTLFSALAQLEREQIQERTSSAMLKHQANGRRMTRADRCPYGWKVDPDSPDRVVEEVEEQAVISRICQERRRGRGLREIARGLDQAGIDSRGCLWSHTTIRSILNRAGKLSEAF